MVESFNSWILEARYMSIKTMLEFIRKKTMDRLGMKGPLCEKWINSFSPTDSCHSRCYESTKFVS